jgi:hypothetical protein
MAARMNAPNSKLPADGLLRCRPESRVMRGGPQKRSRVIKRKEMA